MFTHGFDPLPSTPLNNEGLNLASAMLLVELDILSDRHESLLKNDVTSWQQWTGILVFPDHVSISRQVYAILCFRNTEE